MTNKAVPQESGKPRGFWAKLRAFNERKGIRITAKAYFLDAMSAMALGLFSSLLIGTIFGTLGDKLGLPLFSEIAGYAKSATGAALGVAIAWALHAPPFVLFSSAVVGLAGNTLGGPVGAYISVIIAAEFGKAVSKETKVDLLVTPAVTIVIGTLAAMFIGPAVSFLMTKLGAFINLATELQPFWMGIIVSAVIGIVLTLPISSAALCIMLGLSGIAAGAATAGCCAQMIGFAVMSFYENRWNGLVSQGLGTSMLQMANILRRPIVWVPPIVASMVTGPIATMVFSMESVAECAGMGTCGLVGIFGVFTAMGGGWDVWLAIAVVCFILPALISWALTRLFRKLGWIRPGDLKLDL